MNKLLWLGWVVSSLLVPLPANALPSPLLIQEIGKIAPDMVKALKEQPPGATGKIEIEVDRVEFGEWVIEGVEFELKFRRVDKEENELPSR